MAKIIDLDGHKRLKEDLSRADQLEGLRTLLRCGRCPRRCAKCGQHGEPVSRVDHPGSGLALTLCPGCLDEYTDLLASLRREREYKSPSWHNRAWVRHWLAWLDYQYALEQFLSSAEVLALTSELKED
ncbi:MAG: hypothetical protein AB1896_07795 [Thermodesulfobacteriota bacterium]